MVPPCGCFIFISETWCQRKWGYIYCCHYPTPDIVASAIRYCLFAAFRKNIRFNMPRWHIRKRNVKNCTYEVYLVLPTRMIRTLLEICTGTADFTIRTAVVKPTKNTKWYDIGRSRASHLRQQTFRAIFARCICTGTYAPATPPSGLAAAEGAAAPLRIHSYMSTLDTAAAYKLDTQVLYCCCSMSLYRGSFYLSV